MISVQRVRRGGKRIPEVALAGFGVFWQLAPQPCVITSRINQQHKNYDGYLLVPKFDGRSNCSSNSVWLAGERDPGFFWNFWKRNERLDFSKKWDKTDEEDAVYAKCHFMPEGSVG